MRQRLRPRPIPAREPEGGTEAVPKSPPREVTSTHNTAGSGSFPALPESLRAVFVMREMEGLSTQETAEALSLSTENVKVRLHRARLALREALSGYFSELAHSKEIDES